MISFKQYFLSESTTKYGCLIAYLDSKISSKITKFTKNNIDTENLYEDGIEDTPHITVLHK